MMLTGRIYTDSLSSKSASFAFYIRKFVSFRSMKALQQQLSESFLADDTEANLRRWAAYIVENKIELLRIADLIHAEKFIATRFIWMVGGICETSPETVLPAIPYFFAERHRVQIANYHSSLARMFQLVGIPEELEGEAADAMLSWLQSAEENVTTKNRTLWALQKLAIKYPELNNELRIILEGLHGRHTDAFDRRVRKALESLPKSI